MADEADAVTRSLKVSGRWMVVGPRLRQAALGTWDAYPAPHDGETEGGRRTESIMSLLSIFIRFVRKNTGFRGMHLGS